MSLGELADRTAAGVPGVPTLAHPADVPDLELDELVDELMTRARRVQHTQGRLRALVRAIGSVSAELTPDVVLHNIVEAARRMVGARYAALGVFGSGGLLEQFVPAGLTATEIERLGAPPQGHGLLAAVAAQSQPIRLGRLGSDERSTGLPPGHPATQSFLGVSLAAGAGALYLADPVPERFSREDEELVGAFAAAAATAIGNARMYQESRLQQRWLRASVDIEVRLLTDTGEAALQVLADTALEIASADLVALSLLTADRERLVIEHAAGVGARDLIGARFAVQDTLAGRVMRSGRPLIDPDFRETLPISGVIELGPVTIVPLTGDRTVRGALSLVRRRGRPGFTASEAEMAAGFASHASVALELADARAAEQRVILLEDRDRIAHDLHDHVVEELFAIGVGLERVAGEVTPEVGDRLQQRVLDLDHTIQHIRASIFALDRVHERPVDSVRRSVVRIVQDVTPALGCTPRVHISGAADRMVPGEIAGDVEAVVRELLTNVARHARASRVDLDIGFTGDGVTVLVVDDGCGPGRTGRRSGLANLAARAMRHGGEVEIVAGAAGGTRARWTAHLDADPSPGMSR